jgi:hypothetical protein
MPIVPTISLTIAPQMQLVSSSPNETTTVHLSGKVTVGLARGETAHVTLACAVDTGWPVRVDPAQMTFTGSGSQDYTCDVTVPNGTANTTAGIIVNGRAVAAGLQAVAQVEATVTIRPMDLNPSVSGVANKSIGDVLAGAAMPAGIVIVLVVVAAGWAIFRRKRLIRPDGGEAPPKKE